MHNTHIDIIQIKNESVLLVFAVLNIIKWYVFIFFHLLSPYTPYWQERIIREEKTQDRNNTEKPAMLIIKPGEFAFMFIVVSNNVTR